MAKNSRIVLNKDNRAFRIKLLFDFEAVDPNMPCTYCNGYGTVGGGFKSLDDPTECPRCRGGGIEPKHPPQFPPDLIAHMRKAFSEWLESESETLCTKCHKPKRYSGNLCFECSNN